MRCPHCGHKKTRVTETRESDDSVRRRRVCEACRLRFTTYERAQVPRMMIRAAHGAQRTLSRRLILNVLRAAGAPLPEPTLATIAAGVEAQLRAMNRRIVATPDVAGTAARELALTLGAAAPTADQIAIALEAVLPPRRSPPVQLPLPIEPGQRDV